MSLTLAAPEALWLLSAVPLVWIARQFGRTNFNRRHGWIQAGVRSLLLALLAVALARPVLSIESTHRTVAYLVDVSHSISSQAVNDAAAAIDALNAEVRPDAWRVIAFGEGTTQLADTTALRALAAGEPGTETDAVGRGGSDLERALSEARAERRPGDLLSIVLFSDGRETSGDVRAAAVRLAAEGVPVSVQPLPVRDLGDAWVDWILAPDLVPAGTAVTLTPVIGSQRGITDATIQITDGVLVLGVKRVALEPGSTEVPIDVTFDAAGPRVVRATLTIGDDPLVANNRLSREVVVQPRTRALYVERTPASARYLRDALSQSGFEVTLRAPGAIPDSAEALEAWDVVILSDLARTSIPDDSMAALGTWVEREGGGLLVVGGEAVFGEGKDGTPEGYRHSEIERLLPVTFERQDQPDVALVIVLDKSWSMNGRVMELCKAAAQAAVDALDDRQTVGVISFDDRLSWDVTPRNVGENREEIRQAIVAIQPGGDTLIYPAVEQAYLVLRNVKASAKHVVLLSDGRSYPDDYEGLVGRMVAANMTVSSVAVGPAADVALLTGIADWGKGRGYVVQDASEVPQIFVKEARAAMMAFDEGETITPVVKSRSVLSKVDLTGMPGLRGRTAAVLKETATEVLATRRDDPLLAFWPIGLGRTAVFTSDLKDRWASDWLRWRGYGPFVSAVVRALARQRPEALTVDVVPGVIRGETRLLSVAVEARDNQGRYRDLLRPVVDVRAEDGASATVTARQVAPGRYEAVVIAVADQPLAVSVQSPGEPASPTRHVLPDLDAEYRLRPADEDLLRAIASATGGAFGPGPDDLVRSSDVPQTSRRALWPALVLAALVLWMGDVLLRRVRLFEAAV